MNRKLYICAILSFVFVGVACAPRYVWKSSPDVQQTKNEYFDAEISPVFRFDAYKGFYLKIRNKTAKDLEVDWNKTFYIQDGSRNGVFMFEGIPYAKRKDPKPPDIIPPSSTFSKEIFPSNLAYFSSLAKAWVHEAMKPGENGTHLTVKVDGKEITEKLTLHFSRERPK